MEKVINEFKVVETADGFRIEIKGDKEAIRRMMAGFGPGFFRGKKRFHDNPPTSDCSFKPADLINGLKIIQTKRRPLTERAEITEKNTF